jgi:hypothetical protein
MEVLSMEKKKPFNEEAKMRVLSPETLDAYIRVVKPGAWLMVCALLVLTATVIVWGFTGSLPETLTVNGVLGDSGKVVCYVNVADFSGNINGCSAVVVTADGNSIDANVTEVSVNPFSQPEIAASLSDDWLVDMMAVDRYAYRVTLALSSERPDYVYGSLASVTLITAEMKPISLIFN